MAEQQWQQAEPVETLSPWHKKLGGGGSEASKRNLYRFSLSGPQQNRFGLVRKESEIGAKGDIRLFFFLPSLLDLNGTIGYLRQMQTSETNTKFQYRAPAIFAASFGPSHTPLQSQRSENKKETFQAAPGYEQRRVDLATFRPVPAGTWEHCPQVS